ncbi:CaiB/BaiF CoA transferase family protein [Algicella marina]|uniref:CoA transferase n=1 Tax=Algicella marina TaxID=2683284 RepID=A0A6P1T2Q5_9RHOB|nr:CaiB/BaiF CoA-transferase family protein [Algicella marina]QHQ35943.1 CoA transferase [Algicella marina]
MANRPDAPTDAPLVGLRVLELARVLAGPWIGQTLADLGATIIKVESPAGDDTRSWGPPFAEDGSATYFHCANRGKRSISLDFRHDDDLAVVKRLAADADVVIENFKTGGLEKHGLDYASLASTNPGLVYCSITGFGHTGPKAHLPGYDYIIQAMSGLMSVTGDPDQEPMKTGTALADLFTAMYGLVGIEAALLQRERTGLGQHIDMALLDCQMAVLANQASSYLNSGVNPSRVGNAHLSIVPYQVFHASDGPLVIACGNDGQFSHICQAFGTNWHEDPKFSTNPARLLHRVEIVDLMAAEIAKWRRDDVLHKMETAGVPAGPINTVAEAFAMDQAIARGLTLDLGSSRSAANPIRLSRSELPTPAAPPKLNADGDDIRLNGWD